MAAVNLRRIDNASTKKESDLKLFPPVIIGRGGVLKCGEKKISRNHATIDWDDDGILITSTHINPTYVKVKGVTKLISKGQFCILQDGDEFGLLNEAFWFKVLLSPNNNIVYQTTENSKEDALNKNKIQATTQELAEDGEAVGKVLEDTKLQDINDAENERDESSGFPSGYNVSQTLKCSVEESIPQKQGIKVNLIDREKRTKKKTEKQSALTTQQNNTENISENSIPIEEALNEYKELKNSEHAEEALQTNHQEIKNKNSDVTLQVKRKIQNAMGNSKENDATTLEGKSYSQTRTRILPKWVSTSLNNTVEISSTKNSDGASSRYHGKPQPQNTSQKAKAAKRKNVAIDFDDSDAEVEKTGKKAYKLAKEPKRRSTKAQRFHSISQDIGDVSGEEKNTELLKLHTLSSDEETPIPVASPSKPRHSYKNISPSTKKKPIQENKKKKQSPRKANQYHTISQDYEYSEDDHNDGNDCGKAKSSNHVVSSDEDGNGSYTKSPTAPGKVHSPLKANLSPVKADIPRKSCEFGASCYRKNHHHKKVLSHPGDSDYVSPSEDASDPDDDRPECEYGLGCYRKNPQHRKEFKHTRNLQPPRKAKIKGKRKQDDDLDSENEYDYDDPFLNDDSSDDYAPTDSSHSDWDPKDEQDQEDVKRMMKEAKKFVKNKR